MNTSSQTSFASATPVAKVSYPILADWSVDFLPGNILLTQGKPSDYRTLAHFHYISKKPATWAGVWVVRYVHGDCTDRIVAIGVLSYPSAVLRTRHRVFDLQHQKFGERLKWVNQNIRTISRIIVHPQFRSLGLAVKLTQYISDHCQTRYIEASARMGRAHPFFEKAGLTRVEPQSPTEPVYYWKQVLH